MNDRGSQRHVGETNRKWKFYERAPGRDVQAVEAWLRIFWKEEEDDVLEAEEVVYFAAHPALLADALAKDLMAIEADGLRCVYQNWRSWRQSPLFQSKHYYCLLAALLPSCPVEFSVIVRYQEIVSRNRFADIDSFRDPEDQFYAVVSELRFFAQWLHATNRWDLPPFEDGGNDASNESQTASFEDYAAAWDKLVSENLDPTRARLRDVLRDDFGKTLATDKLTTYRQKLLKQQRSTGPSAVSPPDSAD